MNKKEILDNFKLWLQEHGDEAFEKINDFLSQQSNEFYSKHNYEDERKARQAWVSIIGRVLGSITRIILEEFCDENGLGITSDRELNNPELEKVKHNIKVVFGKHSLLPDGDIIIYKKSNYQVIAILSVKNSFRERYTETPYWKLKLASGETTRNIRLLMVTPDKDDEISSKNDSRKARIVLEHELDGIYIAKPEQSFESSDKIKSIKHLVTDLEKIIEGNQ